MKSLEYHHGGNWFDRLNNALAVDMDSIRSVAFAWDAEGPYAPEDYSLFYNGFLMLRVTFPFGIFIHIKPVRDARFQCGFGSKLNGRIAGNPYGLPVIVLLTVFFGWHWWYLLALLFYRWQTDAKAAQGAHENAPNLGQAIEWQRGMA